MSVINQLKENEARGIIFISDLIWFIGKMIRDKFSNDVIVSIEDGICNKTEQAEEQIIGSVINFYERS